MPLNKYLAIVETKLTSFNGFCKCSEFVLRISSLDSFFSVLGFSKTIFNDDLVDALLNPKDDGFVNADTPPNGALKHSSAIDVNFILIPLVKAYVGSLKGM
jgi:hypothetical protein